MTVCPRCRRGNTYEFRMHPYRYECRDCGLVWGAPERRTSAPGRRRGKVAKDG